jgi:ATP-dependent helicase/nuclease subunit A
MTDRPRSARTGAAPNEAQRRAAEPRVSAWVLANAGSGKTRVLTDRVARLLLAGSDPARILCLTYTKAAAAEMQSRLFARLGQWAMLDDAALASELVGLGERPETLDPARLARARTLFAGALETPGGLKIQTIHAFCDALLRRFPLEAGVAPTFAVLDERRAAALRAAALDALARQDPGPLEALARHLGGSDDLDPLLCEILAHRDRFAGAADPRSLARALGHRGEADPVAIAAALLDDPARKLLAAVLPAFKSGSPTDVKCAEKIARALDAPPLEAAALLEDVFLYGRNTQRREPFSPKRGACPTRATRAALGPLVEKLDALMERIAVARSARIAAAAFERSLALDGFARAFLARYDALRGGSALDFDEMIARAVALLSDPATAAFVLWRLDGGLDHVLVDEAQDTSPSQWRVIDAITEEFFAGEGARRLADGAARTVFVVGDEKQSIYSFQGADPGTFGAMRRRFEDRLGAMGDQLEDCALLDSYRTGPTILSLVDAVFSGPAGAGFAGPVAHRAATPDRPGRVDLWAFLPKPERPDEPDWDRPLDLPMPDDPVLRLADDLAREIRSWLDQGLPIPHREDGVRPIRAGDILILVQRRGTIFHPLIRALKRHRVPVAGADQLRLGAELATRDLLAALRVAAMPEDDLTLASLLLSPLCGLGQDDLFRLAHGRRGRLVGALDASPHRQAAAFVQDIRDQADFLRPYELLERILIHHDGRRRLVARLGREAEDGIDGLIDQTLAHEQAETPTLTGFLAWMERGEPVVVRRRLDERAGEVRLTTVHGAKGLEAPVVILPDTASWRETGRAPQVVPVGGCAAWAPPGAEPVPALEAAEAARRERVSAENRRLLYVALTRAESWLVVCGAGERGKEETSSWFNTIEAAMRRLDAREDERGRLLLGQGWPEPGEAGMARTDAADGEEAPLPQWTASAPQAAPDVPRPLSPSALGGAHALPGEPAEAGDDLLSRGSRLHLLLEALPGVARAARADLAHRLLGEAPDWPDLLAEAEAVLDAPDLAPLLAPSARSEVPLAAPLGGGRIIGRIDRLLVEPDRVLAVDFKSNRVLPASPGDVPEAILRQMGAYAAALAAIFPGRRIETAIVWTRGPVLMPLPAGLVAAALARAKLDPVPDGP